MSSFRRGGMAFDSIDAIGYQLPEFVVTLGQQVIPAVAVVCAAWVHARSGRKLRLKIGDMKAEGQTVETIENLLRQAAEFRDRK